MRIGKKALKDKKRMEMLTFEEVIERHKLFEELRQLRNLKRNLETGIVFDISPELWDVLLNKDSSEL